MATYRNYDPSRMTHYFTEEGMQVVIPPSGASPTPGRVGGFDVLPAKIDPFSTGGTVQLFPLGTKLIYGDREFRYAKMGSGAAGVAGNLYQGVVPLAGHIDEVIGEPAAGSTTIVFTPNTVTTDDIAANALVDGYIHINDESGEGYLYRIQSHPALTGAVAGTITLADPIVVVPAAAATATVHYHRYRNVIIHPSPLTAIVAGVCPCVVTAGDYCWLQYAGPAAVLVDGTHVIGDFVVPSTAVNGAVMPSAAVETDGPSVGLVMAVNADQEYGAIWLCIP